MRIDNILMPTDFSDCAAKALSYAVVFARQHRAKLHLLHVVVMRELGADQSPAAFTDLGQIYDRLDQVAGGDLQKLLAQHQGELFRVSAHRRRGIAAAPEIVDYAASEKIDLVVIGSHGRRGFRRWLVGSVAEEVVRTAPCPVLAIPAGGAEGKVEAFKRIVVPFDFSADSERGLLAAKELASLYGSQIDLLYVVAPTITADGQGGIVPTLQPVDMDRGFREALAQRASDFSEDGVRVEPQVLRGHPAGEIVDFASEHRADLIVIGSHGLSGLKRFFLGSVAARVLRTAHCPVLVMRPPTERPVA